MKKNRMLGTIAGLAATALAGCRMSLNQYSDNDMTVIRATGERVGYQIFNAERAFLRDGWGKETVIFEDPSGDDMHRGGYLPDDVASGPYELWVLRDGKNEHVRNYMIDKEKKEVSEIR